MHDGRSRPRSAETGLTMLVVTGTRARRARYAIGTDPHVSIALTWPAPEPEATVYWMAGDDRSVLDVGVSRATYEINGVTLVLPGPSFRVKSGRAPRWSGPVADGQPVCDPASVPPAHLDHTFVRSGKSFTITLYDDAVRIALEGQTERAVRTGCAVFELSATSALTGITITDVRPRVRRNVLWAGTGKEPGETAVYGGGRHGA